MAKLTDYLPAVMNGKETIRPVEPGPSMFEGIARVATTAISMAADHNQAKKDKAASDAAAKKAALQQEELDAKNDFAQGLLGIGSGDDEAARRAQTVDPARATEAAWEHQMNGKSVLDPTAAEPVKVPLTVGEMEEMQLAANEGNNIGREGARLQAGVRQGRLDRAAYEMKLEALLRESFRKFPNAKFSVLEAAKAHGIDHPIMSEYRMAEAAEKTIADRGIKREEDLIDYAVKNLGMDPAAVSRETMITAARRAESSEFAIRQARDQYKFDQEKAGNDRARLKELNQAQDDAMSEWVMTSLSPQFGAAFDMFSTVINDNTIPDTDRVKAASEFVNVYRPKAYGLINDTITRAVAEGGMSQANADKLRTMLRQQVDDIMVQFSSNNPLNVIQTNATISKMMQDKLKLDAFQAMPVLSAFQQAFGSSEAVKEMVEMVAADPDLQSAFTREMKGFTGLQQGDQTIRIRNMIAFMTDKNTSLRDYTPEQSQQIIKDSDHLLNKGFYRLAVNGDERAQENVLNTLGKVANAATDLNAGSSTRSLINASHMVSNNQAYQVLRRLTANNKEFGGLVADEMRVAGQKTLIALMQQGAGGDPYHKWVLDDRSKTFRIVPTGLKAKAGNSAGLGFMRAEGIRPRDVTPPPSKELVERVRAMNNSVAFLMNTSDFEDNPALKTASASEKFGFYTSGRLPESARPKKGEVSGRDQISRLQNFWSNVKIDWDKAPKTNVNAEIERTTGQSLGSVNFNSDGSRTAKNLAGRSITVPSTDEIANRHAKNPIYQEVVRQASALGIPVDVAVRLGHIETGGRFNDPGRNSAGAYGPLQVTSKNHNDRAQRMFGKNVPELTPAENIAVGLDFLKENYRKHGNWTDAAHDYIGRGDNDGNIKSRTYAELIGD